MYGNDDNQADQRPDRSEGMGRWATVTTGAYSMHACRVARGSKWGGKEDIASEAYDLFAGGIGSAANKKRAWCARVRLGRKGPLAGTGENQTKG
jgi:hypothetical protein